MTSTKELRITHDELRHVVWACPNCGAECSVDFSNKKQVAPVIGGVAFSCGICGKEHSPYVRSALSHLYHCLCDIELSQKPLTFRVPVKE